MSAKENEMTLADIKTWLKTHSLWHSKNLTGTLKDLQKIAFAARWREDGSVAFLRPVDAQNYALGIMFSKKSKKINNCARCGGTGRIEGFSHIHNGVCFACKGRKC